MQELLRNAISGWSRYTDQGKYAVLFLGALLVLWFLGKSGEKVPFKKDSDSETARSLLLKYASLTAAMAVFPLTAVVMMMYQTRFYDYEWIWSGVPVTLVIAWGISEVYLGYCRTHWRGKKAQPVGFAAACLAVIFLCGNLGNGMNDRLMTREGEEKAAAVVDKLTETGNTQDICLWAPQDILQYVRGIDGDIKLLYGRNMWEDSLNAYTYDTYDTQTCKLYEWMEQLAEAAANGTFTQASANAVSAASTGEGQAADDPEGAADASEDAKMIYLETALNYGVNCIIVPEVCAKGLTESLVREASRIDRNVEEQSVEGYHIYRILE